VVHEVSAEEDCERLQVNDLGESAYIPNTVFCLHFD
jgi:hypothetical protein